MVARPLRHRQGRGLAAIVGAVLLLVMCITPGGRVAAATRGIDVRLPLGHQIRGVITSPTGEPVAGADVNASTDSDSLRAVTAADGSYVLHAAADGTYHVLADDATGRFDPRYYGVPDSVADGGQAADVVVNGAAVDNIDIELGAKQPTGISGVVRDPEGHPVGGINVDASGENGFGQATTGVDGTYRIGGLPAGDYRLLVEPPSGSVFFGGPYVDGTVGSGTDAPSTVSIADVDTTDVNIALVLGRTISGHVSMTRTEPVFVDAVGDQFSRALVDASGNFVLLGLAPGAYQILFTDVPRGPQLVESGGFPYGAYGTGGALVSQQDAESIDVMGGNVTLDPVTLPRGTDIVGRVTDGSKGLADAFLFVCDVTGNLGCSAGKGGTDGTFRILHVPTGRFTIFVSVPGRVAGYYEAKGLTVDDAAAGTVSVVSGGPDVKGIKIAVPIGASVSGRIIGPSGEPVVGATASVFPFGIAENARLPLTGSDGRFLMTGIPTNEYGLSVDPPEGSDYLRGYYRGGAPGNYTSDFAAATVFRVIETGDRQAPTITFRDPTVRATGVPPDATITVRFSEPVDNLTAATIQLRDGRGKVVPSTVAFTPSDRTVRVTPTAGLQPGKTYRLVLSSAIVDWSGNHLAAASWSFTT